jgi:anthranilate phosphoribosyltransferase
MQHHDGGLVNEIRDLLSRLIGRQDLSRAEAEALFDRIMDGEVGAAQQAAVLVALASKGETPDEIAGAASAMRRRALRIPHGVANVLDTCGTGGDGKGTANVSTAAALLAAAGGASVAKHGNRSVSSRAGSADVLQALGVGIELPPEDLGRCLEEVGIAFLFAPALHPAMKAVMPVRRELAVRTVFNVLGPLTNPAGATRQLLGVYSPALVEPVAAVLRELGAEHALVVHGLDGLDEITTTAPTLVCEVTGEGVRRFELEPEQAGLPRRTLGELRGGDAAENAALLRRVLEGEPGPLAEIAVLNAGAALYVAGRASDLRDGVEQARALQRSGAAARKLDQLGEVSRALAAAGAAGV